MASRVPPGPAPAGPELAAGSPVEERTFRTRAWLSRVGGIELPLTPPLVLLLLIATHAVNVPRWDDWGLLPFVVAIRERRLTLADFWAQHNEHRLAAVKLLLAPIAQATDFDVRAMMYAGFGLQLLAFVFLWRTLAITLRGQGRLLPTALAFATALLMFSPAQDENWLWGITSLQWHLCNLAAAAAVWLLSRRLPPRLTLPACFLLTCAGMTGVASGVALWGVAFVAIATEAIAARRRPGWEVLACWAAGALVLAFYFTGFRTTPSASDLPFFLAHPREFLAFVGIYIGWPIVQGTNLVLAGIAGLAGLLILAMAFYAALARGFQTECLLPWLWLSSHALLVAVVTAIGRVQTGIVTARTNRYSTGAVLFWVGLLVVVAMTLRWCLGGVRGRRRALALATTVVTIAATLNYMRLYREGYWRFVQTRHDRLIGLVELWSYETAPDEALTLLFPPGAREVREMARTLEGRRLGPFAQHMSRLRSQLSQLTATTAEVAAGEGHLDVAECTLVAGWAWDRRQPDIPVKIVIYGDGVRLGAVPAYWYRHDLAQSGIGNGRHAFFFAPPASLKDGRPHRIRARVAGTHIDLGGSPKPFACSDARSVMWR